jgi:hypothetical protein
MTSRVAPNSPPLEVKLMTKSLQGQTVTLSAMTSPARGLGLGQQLIAAQRDTE